jgi:hypothetical protein
MDPAELEPYSQVKVRHNSLMAENPAARPFAFLPHRRCPVIRSPSPYLDRRPLNSICYIDTENPQFSIKNRANLYGVYRKGRRATGSEPFASAFGSLQSEAAPAFDSCESGA